MALTGAAGLLAFKLYEPVVVYPHGWEALPDAAYPAVAEASPQWAGLGAQADAWLEEARAVLRAPALSAALSIDGERVWAGAAGYADLASLAPATLQTAFRVGSSSKPVTAVAMGTLLEVESVELDAPVSAYVAGLPAPLADITVRQAMNHSGGVREYGVCFCFPRWEYYSRTHYRTQREALRPFEKDPLLFSPGEGFAYSSYGFNLVGAVIEAAAGEGFASFMRHRVFDPLGMDVTHLDDGTPGATDATFYEVAEGRYKKTFRTDNTNRLPSGGVIASPSDMVRIGAQFIAPTLISAATRDTLLAPQTLANGDPMPQGYRLGIRAWREAPAPDGGTTLLLNHHGTSYGATSYFSVYPDYGLVVSVVMNRDGSGAPLIPEFAPALEQLALRAIVMRDAQHGAVE